MKQTDAGEVVLRDGPRGCIVAVPPMLDLGAVHELEAALAGGSPSAAVDPGPSSPAPPRPAVDGLDGRTVARSGLPTGPSTATPLPLVLRFVGGTVAVEPGRPVVLGRDPSPRGGAAGHVVPGDATTVSKSHLLVSYDGAAATVEDLGSTNGSALVRDGASRPLAAGASVTVHPGDLVLLGDCAFVVEAGVRA